MILQSLYALYDRLAKDPAYDLVETGFSPQQIAFRIILHPDGRLFEFQDARVQSDKGKRVPVKMRAPGEAKPPGAGINPCFLWDNQTYLLGRQPEDKPAGFAQKRFEAFRDRHLALEKEIASPRFAAVCRFLEQWTPERLSEAEYGILEEVGPGFGVFQVVGEADPVHEDPAVLEWWKKSQAKNDTSVEGQCLITGEISAITKLHPKIKGIAGAQAAGASIVSFNDTAYESYGKTQGFNSPVGEEAAFRYGAALNNLLNGPQASRHRIRIGDTACVFWTDKPHMVEDIFAAIATGGDRAVEEAQDAGVRKKMEVFLKAVQQGRAAYSDLGSNPDETRFFLLGLAPNAARLSVRFFYQSTLGELLDHLHKHQRDLEIVREFEQPVGKRWADPLSPAYWELLRETTRQGDDPSPLLGGALMRAILEGSPYPEALLTGIIRRVQIERSINYLRAAAIKAVLTRNHRLDIPVMLDPNNTNPAYLHGRLFAVLQKIQEEGGFEQTGRVPEKTIRDTYLASACATPASVFPRLLLLSTHHLRHLHPGRKVQFEQLVAEINWPLTGNARRIHTLEEQGLFLLGYYHQRKAFFTKKEGTAAASI